MQCEIHKVLKLKNFFHIVSLNNNVASYSYREPSAILLRNIYLQWLKSINHKSDKNFPILINGSICKYVEEKRKMPVGYMENSIYNYRISKIVQHTSCNFLPEPRSTLRLNILMPQSEIMQYFLQWQRYRKYWWSTITTSPGLFSLSDIKFEEKTTEVQVLADLPWGKQPIEAISISKFVKYQDIYKNLGDIGKLESVMTLEGALFTLLLDALMNRTPEHYLRLNRTMAPYKLGFTIRSNDDSNKKSLFELATLLNYKIVSNNISTWLPDFSLPLQEQLKLCREIGVTYAAIIDESTLTNGIFHLMNSSTMLKEQIHIADFESYTKMLCQ